MAKISSAGIETPKVKTTDPATRGLAQIVYAQDGALKTINSIIPGDNSIPQNSEGAAVITVVFTPRAIGSTIEIEGIVSCVQANADGNFYGSICRSDAADAISATRWVPRGSQPTCIPIKGFYTTTSIAPVTLTLRVGTDTVFTAYVNGIAGTGYLGGSMSTSLTIKEWLPA